MQLQQALEEILHEAIEKGELSAGNLLVVKNDKELLYIQDGYADVEHQISLKREHIFRLYSMTKPITAVAVMSLVERGKLDLSEPVSKYLPGFLAQKTVKNGICVPVENEMRIVHLLSMVSGLVYDGFTVAGQQTQRLFQEMEGRLRGFHPMTTLEFANRLGALPLAFEPGSSWRYGTSADVLGAIVEVVSGMPYGEYLKTNLFEPLDMNDTGFFVPEEKQSRLVQVYERENNGGMHVYQGSHLGICNDMKTAPAFESGGAGLASTIDDYAKFASMLLHEGEWKGKQILSPYTVKFLTSARLNEVQKNAFGYWIGLEGYSYGNLMRVMQNPGQACVMGTVGEYGWDGWLGPYFSNHPKEKLTILFMMQMTNSGTTPLMRKLKNVIIRSLV